MLQRLAYLLLIWLLLTGCASGRPSVTENPTSAAPIGSPTPSASATPRPTPSAQPTKTPTPAPTATPAAAQESWRSYTNDAGGYTLDIPASWGVSGEPAASVMFFAEDADINQLGTGEPQFFAGGVEILGFIADAPDPYEAVLPNHSAIVSMQEITTPLGAGRVYTLRRDRFQPTGSDAVWYAQHALIPIGSRIVEVWIQVDSPTSEAAVPTLERMLASLRLE